MGNKQSNKNNNKNYTVLIIGFENSGKTALFNNWVYNKFEKTEPTVTYNINNLTLNNLNLNIIDLSGNSKNLWPDYIKAAECIIFIIDGSDRSKLFQIKEEIKKISKLIIDTKKIFSIFISKCDLTNTITNSELLSAIRINKYLNTDFFIERISVKNNTNIKSGLNKVIHLLNNINN